MITADISINNHAHFVSLHVSVGPMSILYMRQGVQLLYQLFLLVSRVAARIPDANLRFAMLKNIAECDRLQKDLEHLIRNGKGDTKEVYGILLGSDLSMR